MTAETMGRNEYARHRGCSRNAVKKADRDGRISAAVVERGPDGHSIKFINWRMADELWERNTDPAAALKSGKVTTVAGAPGAPAADGDYLQHRRRRELAEAQLSELKLNRETGALVEAEPVRKAIYVSARALRDRLLAIPDSVAAVLDPADPARAHRLLTNEIKRALSEFQSTLRQAAAAAGVQTSAQKAMNGDRNV